MNTLEKTFSALNEEHPDAVLHLKAEAEVRQQLVTAMAQLERYQSIYGDPSTLPPDLQHLEAQLRSKAEEIQALKLLDKQHQEVSFSNFRMETRSDTAYLG